jgi:uracil-DNA glycosylase
VRRTQAWPWPLCLAEAVDLFSADAAPGCLQTADPREWPVAPDWQPVVDPFFKGVGGQALLAFLKRRIGEGAVVFPPQPLRALELTPLHRVHTVILGQDPYHGRGQAEGLAFSVAPGQPLPPSLRNIFKERQRDLGEALPTMPVPGGSLVAWAQQGILLLNSCLTVEAGQANSHQGKGWEILTDALIARLSASGQRVAFMLWGAAAQQKRSLIDEKRHLVLCANHPSPLSALRGPLPFLGCGHFSRAQKWCTEQKSS